MANIVVGESRSLFGELIAQLLVKRGHRVEGVYTTKIALLDAVGCGNAGLCLLDHESLGTKAELIGMIDECSRGATKVLTLDASARVLDPQPALRAGARGVISMRSGADVLMAAIDRVMCEDEIVVAVPRGPRRRSVHDAPVRIMASHLTGREREILALLVAGAGTERIARHLCVSPTTVRTHVRGVLTKLGANSRLKAASLAVQYGLVESEAVAAVQSSVPAAS